MEIIDAHVHIGLQSFLEHSPGEERSKMQGFRYRLWNEPRSVLKAMDRLGIAKAIIFPFPFREINHVAANNYISWCCLSFPGRFLPVGLIAPELSSIKDNSNFLGFKQHSVYQDFSPEELVNAYQFMSHRGQVLFVHLPFKDKKKYVRRILDVVPNLKIIVAHMGRKFPGISLGAKEVLNELRGYENIMFDTSSIRDKPFLVEALSIVGEDRVCFGSDCPFGPEGDIQAIMSEELELIWASDISNTAKENIMGGNITRFLFG